MQDGFCCHAVSHAVVTILSNYIGNRIIFRRQRCSHDSLIPPLPVRPWHAATLRPRYPAPGHPAVLLGTRRRPARRSRPGDPLRCAGAQERRRARPSGIQRRRHSAGGFLEPETLISFGSRRLAGNSSDAATDAVTWRATASRGIAILSVDSLFASP